jgi:hypothetical protein
MGISTTVVVVVGATVVEVVVEVVVVGKVKPDTSLLHPEYTGIESLSARTLNWYSVFGVSSSTTADVCIDDIAHPEAQLSFEKKTAYLSTCALDCSGASHDK